ncbi:hypothetical protein HMI56_002191, partial [Coelomomyces lativittatus]
MQKARARVPVVRFTDPETQLSCDINMNNALALQNTLFLKFYVDQHPLVKPLFMLLKFWTHRRQLNDAANGSLSHYAWTILMLFYLQQVGVVPIYGLYHILPEVAMWEATLKLPPCFPSNVSSPLHPTLLRPTLVQKIPTKLVGGDDGSNDVQKPKVKVGSSETSLHQGGGMAYGGPSYPTSPTLREIPAPTSTSSSPFPQSPCSHPPSFGSTSPGSTYSTSATTSPSLTSKRTTSPPPSSSCVLTSPSLPTRPPIKSQKGKEGQEGISTPSWMSRSSSYFSSPIPFSASPDASFFGSSSSLAALHASHPLIPSPYPPTSTSPTPSLASLFYGFFRYFALEFDLHESVVGVRGVETVDWEAVRMMAPQSQTSLNLTKTLKFWSRSQLPQSDYRPFCIEDPLNPTRNLANNVRLESVQAIQLEMWRVVYFCLETSSHRPPPPSKEALSKLSRTLYARPPRTSSSSSSTSSSSSSSSSSSLPSRSLPSSTTTPVSHGLPSLSSAFPSSSSSSSSSTSRPSPSLQGSGKWPIDHRSEHMGGGGGMVQSSSFSKLKSKKSMGYLTASSSSLSHLPSWPAPSSYLPLHFLPPSSSYPTHPPPSFSSSSKSYAYVPTKTASWPSSSWVSSTSKSPKVSSPLFHGPFVHSHGSSLKVPTSSTPSSSSFISKKKNLPVSLSPTLTPTSTTVISKPSMVVEPNPGETKVIEKKTQHGTQQKTDVKEPLPRDTGVEPGHDPAHPNEPSFFHDHDPVGEDVNETQTHPPEKRVPSSSPSLS